MKTIIFAGILVAFLILAFPANAGYDDDFRQASDLNYYPGITNTLSAQLDINLATVIHRENLQIMQTLQIIEERLNKIEASMKVIEQRQASGR